MVPPPLSSKSFAARRFRPHSSISEAISSAASPLQSSFQLSCRSPLSPRVQLVDEESPRNASLTPRYSQGSHLTPPRFFPLIADTSESKVIYSEHGLESDDGDDAVSSTVFSPTDHTWFLSPSTPSALQYGGQQDEGKLGVISAINIIIGKTVGVGAYTIPSAIFDGVGSVGMTLLLWVVGSIISFCGLAVYLDLGTAIPKSGGERVYLERIFRRPRMLATSMFMSYVVLLGFSTPNAIVLGDYVLYALDIPRNRWNVRAIAVLVVSALCYVHARFPKLGVKLINVLGISKLVILVFVILCGAVGGMMGLGRTDMGLEARRLDLPLTHDRTMSTAQRNFSNIWEGSSVQPYDYATALLKVIYCFRGYSTANQVLSDVKNPVRTLKVAAPIALGVVSIVYLAINVAFFLVVDKEDFRSSGVIVAGTFFRNIFGEGVGGHILPFFVIISAAGNIAATAFAQARVNEELAKDGLLPWSGFWTSKTPLVPTPLDSPMKKQLIPSPKTTPSRGLLLHWAVSVAVIVIPPPGKIYNFLVDIGGYPVSVISVAVSLGLLHLQLSPSERWSSPFRANRIAILVFAISNCLLLIFPWIPPVGGRGEGEGFAYYAYPTTALAVLGSGALYWCWWITKGNGRLDRGSRRGKRWAKLRQSGGESTGLLADDILMIPGEGAEAVDADMRRRAQCGCPRIHGDSGEV
ncbi:amino acid transporter-like protein [Xylariales sp. AK1849]|nr:amino acid transporter-like protein [Xylariales sp. AK1849]